MRLIRSRDVSARDVKPRSNDLSDARLADLRKMTPFPATLDELVVASRRTFGWFTRQEARSLEYPWVIENCGPIAGAHVIDVGAGLSPIPIVLAARGASVTTIDYMPADQIDARTRDEWGYFDYSVLGGNLTSLNADASEIHLPAASADVVLSVSVVEHMPARVRRALFARTADWIQPNGRLILTVDLEPGSNRLWNLDRGEVVESADAHGSLDDLEREVSAVGIDLYRVEVVRWAPHNARTDLAFLSGYRRAR